MIEDLRIDSAVRFSNALVVLGRSGGSARPAGLILRVSQGEAAVEVELAGFLPDPAHPEPEAPGTGKRRRGGPFAKAPPAFAAAAKEGNAEGASFAVPVPAEAARLFADGERLKIEVLAGSEILATAFVRPEPLTVSLLVSSEHRAALGRALAPSCDGMVGRILAGDISVKPLDIPGGFWAEQLVQSGCGLVFRGWMANLASRTVHAVTNDLLNWRFHDDLKLIARGDVHEHLRQAGALTSASDEHGVAFVLPNPAGIDQDIYFVEVDEAEGRAVLHGPLPMRAERNDRLALDIVREVFGPMHFLGNEAIALTYRPILATPKAPLAAERFTFGPPLPQGRPVASIIIPFYGDAFFLNCVYHLQRVLDDRFELVIVVDDPRIWPEIHRALSLRSTGMTVPTQLLRNLTNYGYGGANNLAARLAQGDVLLLMNSDVLVTDVRPLVQAAETIRERRLRGEREAVVGFSLLYEDHTIQHIGMEFRRSSEVGNLFLADHPMKGFPFDFYDGEAIRSVPAVTAALVALSTDLYRSLGGFDPAYERGDFEDADLCLKARRAGADIQVHVHPGLYHLERQSIRRMADEDTRGLVTYMNCAEFNHRWEAELNPPKRVFRVPGRGASA